METLPPEILCDIFLKSLPHPHRYGRRLELRDSIAVPLCITHVCKAWRSLALSFGELWSYLHIDYIVLGDDSRFPPMVGDIVDTWIARSHGTPLDYEVTCAFYDVDDMRYHADGERVVSTLLSQQHRWRNIEISCDNVLFSSQFLASGISLEDMPLLKSLSLKCKPLLNTRCILNITRSPQLEHLELDNNFGMDTIEGRLRLLKQIRLVGHGFGISKLLVLCRNVLENAPYLDALYADFPDTNPLMDPQLPYDRAVLTSNLRRLTLVCSDISTIMFNAWKLPSLRELDLQCFSDSDILVDFLKHSSPPLTLLTLRHLFAAERLAEMVSLLPTLQGLQLLRVNIPQDFFLTLAVNVRKESDGLPRCEEVRCPRLEVFNCIDCHVDGDDDPCGEHLITMLKSRAKIMPSFRTVYHNDPWAKYDVDSVEKWSFIRPCVDFRVGDIDLFYRNFV